MLTLAYYLLKVSVCSGALFSYYFFTLRNNRFHQYNRFYLLLTVILSWIIPLIKIDYWNNTVQHEMPALELLKVVATRDAYVEKSLQSVSILRDINTLALIIFSFISAAFFVWLIAGIIKIILLIRSNPNKSLIYIHFIFSDTKGTPFSFFKYIFWNKNIDLQTEEGNQILQHELTHVYEKHSADKLFIHLTLVIGWLNPFFWLIRKELNIIHEFIADEKAISNGDAESFSAMLIKTAYPQHSFALANSFFHSPIKRRLIMFTTSKNPSYSYLRRLLVLPLLCFVIVFFSFKSKGQNSNKQQDNQSKVSAGQHKGVVITNVVGKDSFARTGWTDTTIKIKDGSGRIIKITTNEPINIKTNRVDTPALPKALVVVDGVQMSMEEFYKKNIPAEQIKEINILKDKLAIDKYGQKGANGVMEVNTHLKDVVVVDVNLDGTTRSKGADSTEPQFARVFTRVENPPYYAKGMAAFADYIQSNVQYPKQAIENKKEGAVAIKFIIDENGNLSHFEKASYVGFGLEEEAIRLIKNLSGWVPGIQNGHKVPVEIVQQIIFHLPARVCRMMKKIKKVQNLFYAAICLLPSESFTGQRTFIQLLFVRFAQ